MKIRVLFDALESMATVLVSDPDTNLDTSLEDPEDEDMLDWEYRCRVVQRFGNEIELEVLSHGPVRE